MGRPEGQVQEERPVGTHALRVVHELDGAVHEVLGDVVAVLRLRRRVDEVVVVGERGAELVGLALEEPVEAVETPLEGPVVERPGRRALFHRGQMPFAHGEGGIALVVEDLGHGGGVTGDVAGHVGEAGVEVAHRPHADGVVVATGEQRGPGGGTQRGDVEVGVAEPVGGEGVDVGRVDVGSVAAELGEPEVVEEDHDHVRGLVAGVGWFGEPRLGFGDGGADRALPSGVVLHGSHPPGSGNYCRPC